MRDLGHNGLVLVATTLNSCANGAEPGPRRSTELIRSCGCQRFLLDWLERSFAAFRCAVTCGAVLYLIPYAAIAR